MGKKGICQNNRHDLRTKKLAGRVTTMYEIAGSTPHGASIKVIGIGGCGGNAVKHMIANNVEGVDFICANTDAQALADVSAKTVLQIGSNVTKGLGAGTDPEVGRLAAVEDRERIAEVLAGADMVFITAGMGGGTGTGASPVVAEIARELGILTVAVVTRPFPFEGKKRMLIAEQGIKQLLQHVDSLIIIPNEKLLSVLGKNTSLLEAFKAANDILLCAVKGIADLVLFPGMINVDFADVRAVMSDMGMAMMGTGKAQGENRSREAAEGAIRSPLLEDVNLQGVRGMLVNITAGMDLSLGEFAEVGDAIEEYAADTATVVVGTVIDPGMSEEIYVTVVATGLDCKRDHNNEVEAVLEKPPRPVLQDDYRDLDHPTVLRNRQTLKDNNDSAADLIDSQKMEVFDIPTYLRRRTDF